MKPSSHQHSVQADGFPTGITVVSGAGVPPLQAVASPQLNASTGLWSPQTLLLAAVADSFVLTFRSVSQAAGFPWGRLQCEVEGMPSAANGERYFPSITIRADLEVLSEHDKTRALELLHRTERTCPVAKTLRSTRSLEVRIHGPPALAA